MEGTGRDYVVRLTGPVPRLHSLRHAKTETKRGPSRREQATSAALRQINLKAVLIESLASAR